MSTSNSISSRLGGIFFALKSFASEQFWGGHPNTFRGFFAFASLFLAWTLHFQEKTFETASNFELMLLLADNDTWALAFFIHWLAITLIVLRTSYVRVCFQLLVNCYGIFIWSIYIVLQDISLGHSAINASAERVMVLYGFWALVRTGMNRWSDHK